MKSVLAIYICVALVITSTELFLQFKSETHKLQTEINQLINIFQPMLAQSLWEYNDEQMTVTSLALMDYEALLGVKLESDLPTTSGLHTTKDKEGNKTTSINPIERRLTA